jgi:hypothetical protein
MYENGTMKPAETILKREREGERRMMDEVNLRYTLSTFVNVTMHPQ